MISITRNELAALKIKQNTTNLLFQKMIKRVIKDVSSENLRSYHMELTKAPHIAGLNRDQELTSWIKKVKSK